MLVLLIEDDADAREAVTDALSQEGFAVAAHADAEAALRWLECGGSPDAILSDHWIKGGMNGLEFRSRQRQIAAASQIPFVLMTADDAVTGVDDPDTMTVMRKPFDLEQLRTTLRVAARQRVDLAQ